jgi:hypothetical protein
MSLKLLKHKRKRQSINPEVREQNANPFLIAAFAALKNDRPALAGAPPVEGNYDAAPLYFFIYKRGFV